VRSTIAGNLRVIERVSGDAQRKLERKESRLIGIRHVEEEPRSGTIRHVLQTSREASDFAGFKPTFITPHQLMRYAPPHERTLEAPASPFGAMRLAVV
jgi:hypothetical protein